MDLHRFLLSLLTPEVDGGMNPLFQQKTESIKVPHGQGGSCLIVHDLNANTLRNGVSPLYFRESIKTDLREMSILPIRIVFMQSQIRSSILHNVACWTKVGIEKTGIGLRIGWIVIL